ncbi:MAG: DIP1984 family protein [Oscillospiraceae bacterium]|nr:DIP1984 family protein [Oscillospiraceae bacterium]
MKLAEALQERADINKKISQLRSRLSNNVLVQEGEKTAEDPNELIKELDQSLKRLQHLIERINLTNCNTYVDNKTITELLARKDILTLQLSAYRDLIDQGSRNTDRARHSEIKILSTINVVDIQKKVDRLAKELRSVDNLLQETNWNTELL